MEDFNELKNIAIINSAGYIVIIAVLVAIVIVMIFVLHVLSKKARFVANFATQNDVNL